MKENKLETRHKILFALIFTISITAVFAYATKNLIVINLLCLLISVLGLWGIVYSIQGMVESIKSKSWIPKRYKVVNSHFTFVMTRKGRGGQTNKCKPFFEVEYEHNNVKYRRTSDELNLHVDRIFSTPHDANEYLDKVKAGLYREYVYVNPDDPGKAFIRTGITRDQISVLSFSMIILVLSLLTIFNVIKWQSGTH